MNKPSKSQRSSRLSSDILDLVPSLELHDWEDAEAFKALEEGFISQFAPATAMELSIVKRLAANEWESHRSDKQRADITRSCLRKAALESLTSDVTGFLPTPDDQQIADDFVSDDATRRKAAIATLAVAGFNLSDLNAQAYLTAFREFEALERRPDVFDRRRRDLLEDFRRLEARRQQAQIEDAELVDADGN